MEKVIAYYKNVLGIDLENLKHPLSAKIKSAFLESGIDQKISKYHLARFAIALIDIKNFKESIYDFYIKKIVNNTDVGVLGYFFEAIQCAHCIRTSVAENLEFVFGDHTNHEPDFIINGCGFEITSTRFVEISNKNTPGKKVLSAFRDKNKKPYANDNCLLMIEISHVTHNLGNGIDMTVEELENIIKRETKFGLVILINEWFDIVDGILRSKPIARSTYSENCSPVLKDLIESKFIKGQTGDFQSTPFTMPF